MLLQAERLVAKLQLEQEVEWQRKELKRKQRAANPTVTLDMKADQAISMIRLLREKKDDIYAELGMRHSLQLEHASYMRAVMELREANLTTEERQARDEDIRKGQILYSKVCPELHPDWRQLAQEEFNKKRI